MTLEEAHPNLTSQGDGEGSFDMDFMRDGHIPLVLEQRPFEEQLLQRTLWPEMNKLYGHGNELYTMTCSWAGHLFASACACKVRN